MNLKKKLLNDQELPTVFIAVNSKLNIIIIQKKK